MGYLPGQVVSAAQAELNENPCNGPMEEGCGQPSTVKQVGETDSFGSEFWYYCRGCFDKLKEHAKANPHLSTCEKCHTQAVLKAYRDPDEGMSGPVYYACGPCIKKYMEYYQEDVPNYFEPLEPENLSDHDPDDGWRHDD